MPSRECWLEKKKNIEAVRHELEVERQRITKDLGAVTRSTASYTTKSAALERLEARQKAWKDRSESLKQDAAEVDRQLANPTNPLMYSGLGAAPEGTAMPTQTKNHRGQLLGSPMQLNESGWRSLLDGAAAGHDASVDFNNETHLKSFVDGVTTKSGNFDAATVGSAMSSGLALPSVMPPLPPALEQTRISSLFPHVAIGTMSFEYMRVEGYTGGPAITAEGAVKPDVGLTTNVVLGRVAKIAGKHQTTLELGMTLPDLVDVQLPSILTRCLVDAENLAILDTLVPDANVGSSASTAGLLASAGLTAEVSSSDTAPGSPGLRAINAAIGTLRVGAAYAEADSIILNPTTWTKLRGAVNSLGDFILDAQVTGDGGLPELWGLRVALSSQMPAGEALIFDSNQFAKIYVRSGPMMLMSNQGLQLMETNQTLTVIEEFIGLSIPRADAGLLLTGIVD